MNTIQEEEPTEENPREIAGIKSVEKAAQILHALARSKGSLRLVDLAAEAGMSRSMARGYLVSLIRSGLIDQDGESGRYDLGPAAVDLGFAALSRMDFLKTAYATLRELSATVRETAILSVWNAQGPVVVAKVDGRDTVYEIRIGAYVTLEPTSTGHVFMAFLPRDLWAPLLGRASSTRGTAPLTASQIDALIAQIRATGVSVVKSTPTIAGFGGISAPVFDEHGELHAAITIVGPSGMFDEETTASKVNELLLATRSLSRSLGWRGADSA